jgi:stress-induced morphogen
VKPEDITAKIVAALPDAEVALEDLTGTLDHWKATIVSPSFAGKSLIQRQRLVNAALAEELRGPIHALSMDTWTPEEALARRART